MNDLFLKLLIIRTPGIGPVKYADLIAKFGSPAAAADALAATQDFKDTVRREMDNAADMGICYITDDDPMYPRALVAIKNHPPVLTVRGNPAVLAKPGVGMVGTRHASGAGMKFMADLATTLADHGMAIVSGMAMGTDTAAHSGALRASGDSQTIAVLAGGVDYIWPLENESLYHKIIERGALISEMPVGFVPVATNFVQRNRWVAGLSGKLILGEADLKSGSMTTAGFAAEYNRPVFAIPSHPSDPRAAGPNKLIKDGLATLCDGENDFINGKTVNMVDRNSQSVKKSERENDLIDKLGMIPLSESVLAELVKKSIAEIKRDLVVLELRGFVRKQDGGYVRI